MKQQIRKILRFTLLVIFLYIVGVFNEITIFSLLVILPVVITYIILIVRLIRDAYR